MHKVIEISKDYYLEKEKEKKKKRSSFLDVFPKRKKGDARRLIL